MSRPTPDRPDREEELLSRLVFEAGDPEVEPRPEHVAALRALLLARLGPPKAGRPLQARWLVLAGLAAACGLALLVWPRGGGKSEAPRPSVPRAPEQVAARPRPDASDAAAWRSVRRGLDVSQMPTYSWPLQGPSPLSAWTAIPPDLLD